MMRVTKHARDKVACSPRRTRLIDPVTSAKSEGGEHRPPTGGGKNSRTAPKGSSAAEAIADLTKRLARAKRHIARLEARADTDFLLDIPNRRGFERELNRSIAYVKRYRVSAALLMIDVDRLKPVNDRFGHAAGDHMLESVVALLSANIRQSDMIGRLGGDEFGILLWNLDEADALMKAAALERMVDATVCEYRGHRMTAGVSIGVAMLGSDDETASVLERADQAMYARKQARRTKRKSSVRR